MTLTMAGLLLEGDSGDLRNESAPDKYAAFMSFNSVISTPTRIWPSINLIFLIKFKAVYFSEVYITPECLFKIYSRSGGF